MYELYVIIYLFITYFFRISIQCWKLGSFTRSVTVASEDTASDSAFVYLKQDFAVRNGRFQTPM